MFALRFLVLLNLIALCGFATTVTPSAGLFRWMRSGTSGWFEVRITTNTVTSQLPDYIYLNNVSLLIDITNDGIADQSVSLYRAPSQAMAGTGSHSTAATQLLPQNCDCPSGTADYYSLAFTPDLQIYSATLAWLPAAMDTPLYDPRWRYNIPSPASSGVFEVNMSTLVNQVTMINGGSAFAYTSGSAYTKQIRLSGEAIPEPSTVFLAGAGLLVLIARSRARRGARQTPSR